jgi:hypothetical protein
VKRIIKKVFWSGTEDSNKIGQTLHYCEKKKNN